MNARAGLAHSPLPGSSSYAPEKQEGQYVVMQPTRPLVPDRQWVAATSNEPLGGTMPLCSKVHAPVTS